VSEPHLRIKQLRAGGEEKLFGSGGRQAGQHAGVNLGLRDILDAVHR
jgi:hypothetical protein